MRLGPGTRLGPYEIVAPVAAGGMGEVYRGRDPRLKRDIAVKILHTGDPQWVRRFEQEAQAASRLNHPNILAVYDVGVADGVPYLITELLGGETTAWGKTDKARE
jgi:serine/threonine protein kinase